MPASPYPKTYRATRGWRIFFIGLASICGIPSLIGSFYFSTSHHKEASGDHLLVGFLLLMVIGCIYLVLTILRSRIVLYADRVEIHELTFARTLLRYEIAAWRVVNETTPPMLILERKEPAKGKVKTGLVYDLDPTFRSWLAGIPNGEAAEQQASVVELEHDSQLGTSSHQRRTTVERAHRLCRMLNAMAFALLLWG